MQVHGCYSFSKRAKIAARTCEIHKNPLLLLCKHFDRNSTTAHTKKLSVYTFYTLRYTTLRNAAAAAVANLTSCVCVCVLIPGIQHKILKSEYIFNGLCVGIKKLCAYFCKRTKNIAQPSNRVAMIVIYINECVVHYSNTHTR